MSNHKAIIDWRFSGGDFVHGNYSREHTWSFDGGLIVPASPSPSVVPVPHSNPANVDPEEAYIASISSCHMLTFLYIASRAGFQVNAYHDEAIGHVTKNEKRNPWVSLVELHLRIEYGDKKPTADEEERLHHAAHESCFIANSVKTEIRVINEHGAKTAET
jgi:organic hydroperoxide reductase OsmC/OhrA